MKATGLRIGLVGPLPPPFGGMANQMQQLAQLLHDEGIIVELIQVNSPYHPRWTGKIKGIRAVFRLFPYLIQLWQSADKIQLFHIFANSGWSLAPFRRSCYLDSQAQEKTSCYQLPWRGSRRVL